MALKYSYQDFVPDRIRAIESGPASVRETAGLEGVNHPAEFWEKYRTTRIAQYGSSDSVICQPVHKAPDFLIPKVSWVYENREEMKRLAAEWHRLDPEFKVIYDPLTTRGGPGYHLYRVIRNGYRGMADWLILECSIQRDMSKGWPKGEPCRPSMQHVDFIRRHLKSNYGGDARQAHHAAMQAKWEGQLAQYYRAAREEAAAANEIHEEVTSPYLLRNREIPGLMKKRASRYNPPTRPLRLRFP